MTTQQVNFTPLFRQSVGFDRMAKQLQARKLHAQHTAQSKKLAAKVPFNISQRDEHHYQITMALAGFDLQDIEITVSENKLLVEGKKKAETPAESTIKFIHQGIQTDDFSQEFALAEHVKVTQANMMQGLLTIDLHRDVPEALKPRKVAIGSASLN